MFGIRLENVQPPDCHCYIQNGYPVSWCSVLFKEHPVQIWSKKTRLLEGSCSALLLLVKSQTLFLSSSPWTARCVGLCLHRNLYHRHSHSLIEAIDIFLNVRSSAVRTPWWEVATAGHGGIISSISSSWNLPCINTAITFQSRNQHTVMDSLLFYCLADTPSSEVTCLHGSKWPNIILGLQAQLELCAVGSSHVRKCSGPSWEHLCC